MISATDFKTGLTVEIEGNVFLVLEFQHVKPGKGAAFVRTKLRNLTNGGIVDRTFRPSEKMTKAHIERQDMEYLYKQDDIYNFMNTTSYEQIEINSDDVQDTLKYIKENTVVKILTYNDKIFGIEPPLSAELRVVATEPGFKGNTSQSTTKPCTVETGANVKIPLFIEIDEIIRVDTKTGEYLGRA